MVNPIFLLALLAPRTPQASIAESGPLALLRAYNEAIQNFQPDKLQAVFAPDYTEVSPVGEVDSREKVIGFYSPTQKPTGIKSIHLDEPLVRTYGEFAVVIGKEVFEREGGPSLAMRGTFVCRKQKNRWQLVSAQFTGIRPK